MQRRSLTAACLAVLGASLAAAAGAAAEPAPAPALVRDLRRAQDEVVSQATPDAARMRALTTRTEEYFASRPHAYWREARNAKALLAYVLAGGNTSLLQAVIERAALPEAYLALGRGVLAYFRGTGGDAEKRFLEIDARTLDPSLAGHTALMQAIILMDRKDAGAARLLQMARLLAPGTLVEESALRRLVAISHAPQQHHQLARAARQYWHRFARSAYAPLFQKQLALTLLPAIRAMPTLDTALLDSVFDGADGYGRGNVLLEVARRLLIEGKLTLASGVVGSISALPPASSAQRARTDLYAAASAWPSSDPGDVVGRLRQIDRSLLDSTDVGLLDATLDMAGKIMAGIGPRTRTRPIDRPSRASAKTGADGLETLRKRLKAVDALVAGDPT